MSAPDLIIPNAPVPSVPPLACRLQFTGHWSKDLFFFTLKHLIKILITWSRTYQESCVTSLLLKSVRIFVRVVSPRSQVSQWPPEFGRPGCDDSTQPPATTATRTTTTTTTTTTICYGTGNWNVCLSLWYIQYTSHQFMCVMRRSNYVGDRSTSRWSRPNFEKTMMAQETQKKLKTKKQAMLFNTNLRGTGSPQTCQALNWFTQKCCKLDNMIHGTYFSIHLLLFIVVSFFFTVKKHRTDSWGTLPEGVAWFQPRPVRWSAPPGEEPLDFCEFQLQICFFFMKQHHG